MAEHSAPCTSATVSTTTPPPSARPDSDLHPELWRTPADPSDLMAASQNRDLTVAGGYTKTQTAFQKYLKVTCGYFLLEAQSVSVSIGASSLWKQR